MKKFIISLAAVSLSLLLLACSSRSTYENGYDDGYSDGLVDGKAESDVEWFNYADESYDDGYDDGYSEGSYDSNDNYAIGYGDGYSDGYADGTLEAYLSLGEIDLAFQYAQEDLAWIPFVPAYNIYIDQIYTSPEERTAITDALLHYFVDDDIAQEEVDLLFSTFGEELFVRNGIVLTS